MRENNRKSIARIGKLPQFTTMNVIDGQAVQGLYASLIFYSLTIDNILNIIVLLILAGVAISTLAGNDNILKNAGTAVEKYNEKALAEQGILNEIEKKLIEYSNGGGTSTETPDEPETPPTEPDKPTPPTVDANGLLATGEEPYTIQPTTDNPKNLQIVIPAGFAPAVLAGGNNPGQNGRVASILPEDQWNSITATQIDKGIVIVDHAITYDNGQSTGTVPDFNEYVWVPITGSGENPFAPYPWTTPYGYDSDGNYVRGTGVTHQLAPTSTANRWWEDKTTTEYTNMVTSISGNKGFYISRYEASKDSTGTIAQSKRGQTPWIAVSQTAALTASTNAKPTVHTHLMYGVEWDSTLRWLKENAIISSSTEGQIKTMEESDIQTNSCSWGNFYNSTGDAATNSGDLRNTGYSEYWKANNIYDLAGNVHEWTQEKYSTGSDRATRGGGYRSYGDDYPAAYRYYSSESDTDNLVRVPFQLLLVALNSGSEAQCK